MSGDGFTVIGDSSAAEKSMKPPGERRPAGFAYGGRWGILIGGMKGMLNSRHPIYTSRLWLDYLASRMGIIHFGYNIITSSYPIFELPFSFLDSKRYNFCKYNVSAEHSKKGPRIFNIVTL